MNSQKRQTISCSELGLVAKCPKAYAFKFNNVKQSSKAAQRMKVGISQHNNFNKQIKQQSGNDKRCYVATHLYGEHGIETQRLRIFRDNTLLKSRIGKFIVEKYYLSSPSIVRVCEGCKPLDIFLAVPVRIIVSILFTFDSLKRRAQGCVDD